MGVSIKWCDGPAGVLRIHHEEGQYGDEYIWCCTVEREGDTAILHGAVDVPKDQRLKMVGALKEHGFEYVSWLRKDRGWKTFRL